MLSSVVPYGECLVPAMGEFKISALLMVQLFFVHLHLVAAEDAPHSLLAEHTIAQTFSSSPILLQPRGLHRCRHRVSTMSWAVPYPVLNAGIKCSRCSDVAHLGRWRYVPALRLAWR